MLDDLTGMMNKDDRIEEYDLHSLSGMLTGGIMTLFN
jgi:hypothetical protein